MNKASNAARLPAEGEPTSVCVVDPRGLPAADRLLRALSGWGRAELHVLSASEELGAALCNIPSPSIVIAAAAQTPEVLRSLEQWLSSNQLARSVLLSKGGGHVSALRGLRKNVRCVILEGSVRREARLIEAVATAVGIAPRVHLRVQDEIEVDVTEESGRITKAKVINISVSGVKLAIARPLEIGMPVSLLLRFPHGPVTVEAVPMRTAVGPEGTSYGLQFEDPSDELADAVRALDGALVTAGSEEPARGAPRYRLAPRLRVKARLTGPRNPKVLYAPVADLSLRGLAVRPPPGVKAAFRAGERLELLLTWEGKSLRASALVIRPAATEGADLIGLGFDRLSRAAHSALRSLLTEISAREAAVLVAPKKVRAKRVSMGSKPAKPQRTPHST